MKALRNSLIVLCLLPLLFAKIARAQTPGSPQVGTCDQYHPSMGAGWVCINNGASSGWYPIKGDVTSYTGPQCSPTNNSKCGELTLNAAFNGHPGGNPGQLQTNNAGSFGGTSGGGDVTWNGTLFRVQSLFGGTPIAASATTDTTNAANISSGTLPVGRLPTTAVVPGSYTATNLTVDQYGRITAATSGGAGTVTNVTASSPITSSGGATPDIGITLPLIGDAVTLAGDTSGASNSNQVTVTHLAAPLPINQGGTAATTANASTFFSGPITGGAVAPSFRAVSPLDVPGTSITLTNDSGTGTTLHSLAKYGTSGSTAVIAATSDTKGIVGIVKDGAGTTGNVKIQQNGIATCNFDATAVVYMDYVQISSTVAGKCHDAGAAYPSSGQVIGQVNQTGGAGSLPYEVNLSLFNVATSPGGSGTVDTGSGPQIAQYAVGTSSEVGPITISGAATLAQGGALTLSQPYSATTYTNHGVIIGQAGSDLTATAVGITGQYLRGAAGADPIWSTLLLPNSATQGSLLAATSADVIGSIGAGALDTLLQGQGAGTLPAYVAVNNCATSLTYNTTTHAFGCATPVTSLAGTADQIQVSAATGAVTLSLIGPYTPATYTAHAPLIGESNTSISASPGVGLTGQYLRGAAAADPIWSTLILPNAATKGDILAATSTDTIASIGAGAANTVLMGQGAGNVPAYSGSPTLTAVTAATVTDSGLTNGNCVQAGVGGVLSTVAGPCAAGGSGTVNSGTQGKLAWYASSAAVLSEMTGAATAHGLTLLEGTSSPVALAPGGTGTYLRGAGGSSDPLWSTLTLPNAAAVGDVFVGSASNQMGSLAIGAANTILTSNGSTPGWVAPNSAATTISGTVTGTAVCKQSALTLTTTCVLTNYNSTPQSYTYPTAYTTLASINDVQMGLGAQALLTTLLLPQGGPVTGVITVVGS